MPLHNSALDSPEVLGAYEAFAQMAAQAQPAPPMATPQEIFDAQAAQAYEAFAQMAAQAQPAPALATPQQMAEAEAAQAAQAFQEMAQPAPSLHTVKNGLNGGELSPDAQCRFDLPKYQLGCELLLNMIPMLTGGITKRPPLKFIANLGSGAEATRLLPFVYSSSVQFMFLICASPTGKASIKWIDRDGNGAPAAACTLPYQGSQIQNLSIAQCGKVLYFAHPKYPPGKVVVDIHEGGSPSLKYEQIKFRIKTPAPASISPEWNGDWDWDVCRKQYYCATAIDKDTGEESTPCPPFEIYCPEPNSTIGLVNITVARVPNCKEYRIYKRLGGSYGFIGRLVIGEGEGDGKDHFYDTGIALDVADPPPDNPENCFEKSGDYPSIVFIHQQRLGFAASDNQPLTIWMSQTSNFECRATKSPPNDDDAIEATLASTEANRILWAVPDRTGLAIGTEGGEWYLTGADGSGAVSPNSLSFQQQTSYGSEPGIEPVRCEKSLVFCQRGGRHVRDFGYSFQADRYEASDLTLLAHHLFRFTQIKSWAWQANPDCILWIATKAGQLLGVTYLPEHEITAWHRHETPGGLFQSVATLDDSDGRSRLWAVVLRSGGRYCLEILAPRFEGLPKADWDWGASGEIPIHLDGPDKAEFRARCIPCIPEGQAEGGLSALRLRKLNTLKARVVNSEPFYCRVTSQNAPDTEWMQVPAKTTTPNAKKYGRMEFAEIADWATPLAAGFREGARLELIFDGPKAATVLGIAIDMEISAGGGGQV